MSFKRRSWILATLTALAAPSAALLPVQAHAQAATTRILVGFPAGGGSDAIARILAEHLRTELGASVVVENKAGAGGQLAAQALKAAAPDGHTLFLSHDHSVSI
ncbi:MAG: tripartite tricarboxylate transporter substrate-binding protein, partial [Burkholderiaceae bacterium]